MTFDTLVADAPPTAEAPTPVESPSRAGTAAPDTPEPRAEEKSAKSPAKKTAGKKAKTLELTLTVTGTADGDWRAELKRGSSYVARDLPIAAAAVSRAAKQLHEDISVPIDELIEEARAQQAARVAALESELERARKALAELE